MAESETHTTETDADMWTWTRTVTDTAEPELETKSDTAVAEAGSGTGTDPDSDTDSVLTLEEMTSEEKALLLEPDPELTEEEKVLQGLHLVCCKRFTEYDPKTSAFVCTRFCSFNIAFFDLDEESEAIHGPPLQELSNSEWRNIVGSSVNVISLRVIKSDVGYPINVFGSVIARDEVDYKCVHLFRRDRDDAQLIESPKDMLTLTGPCRGFVVSDRMFFEINLKIKGDETTIDRDFSKGVIEYPRVIFIASKRPVVQLLTSWRSTVELVYAPVPYPVAATLEVNILSGPCDAPFNGKITAWTIGNVDNHIILYEYVGNKATGNQRLVGDDGSILLTRNLVAVPVPNPTFDDEDKGIVLNVCFISGNEEGERTTVTLQYPQEERVRNHGSYALQVKVYWTAIVTRPVSKGIYRRWCSVPEKPLGAYGPINLLKRI